jgi:hypothetical protein
MGKVGVSDSRQGLYSGGRDGGGRWWSPFTLRHAWMLP